MENKERLVEEYLNQVLIANETTNLTRITDFNEARILHIEDSLSGLTEINDAPEGLYGDLGTGGGFPGVPIAIYTGRKTVLVDSVKKKIKIIEEILDSMGYSGLVSTYTGRIEDLGRERKGEFSVLTARALSQLPSLVELASPLLKKNGYLVCYKANIHEEELDHAISIEGLTGMKFVSRRSFELSDGLTHREIVCFKKIAQPRIKLPRRVGLAQHNPLKPGKR